MGKNAVLGKDTIAFKLKCLNKNCRSRLYSSTENVSGKTTPNLPFA